MICGPNLRRIICCGVKRMRAVICNRRYSYQMDANPAESSVIRRNRSAVYRYVAEYRNPRESDINRRNPMPDMPVSRVYMFSPPASYILYTGCPATISAGTPTAEMLRQVSREF